MRCEGPSLTLRTLEESDSNFVLSLFADWEHGFSGGARGHGWDIGRNDHYMRKLLNDARVQPPEIPCGPFTNYREAVVIERASGEPIGLDVWVVRGSDAPHNVSGFHESNTEVVALIPSARGQGISSGELGVLGMKLGFDIALIEVILFDMVADTPESRAVDTSRGYTEHKPRWDTGKGPRYAKQFTSADWIQRKLDHPDEANQPFSFEA